MINFVPAKEQKNKIIYRGRFNKEHFQTKSIQKSKT